MRCPLIPPTTPRLLPQTGILQEEGLSVAPVYGSMDMTARKHSVGRFRGGKASVLLVTDVAARGIDIPLLDCAVNYDFPPKAKLFVHRVGRVARAGRAGTAYSLCCRDDLPYLVDLHLFLGRKLEPTPEAPATQEQAQAALDAAERAQTSLVGGFFKETMDGCAERVKQVLDSSPELQPLVRVAQNAFGKYCKTRPPASAESVRRSRELGVMARRPAVPPPSIVIMPAFGVFFSLLSDLRARPAPPTRWLPRGCTRRLSRGAARRPPARRCPRRTPRS